MMTSIVYFFLNVLLDLPFETPKARNLQEPSAVVLSAWSTAVSPDLPRCFGGLVAPFCGVFVSWVLRLLLSWLTCSIWCSMSFSTFCERVPGR